MGLVYERYERMDLACGLQEDTDGVAVGTDRCSRSGHMIHHTLLSRHLSLAPSCEARIDLQVL
jgi:hypothetical protein